MMRYLLDTNVLIELLRRRDSPVTRKIAQHFPDETGIPVLAVYELYAGAYRSNRVEANLQKIRLLRFPILALGEEDVYQAARIKASLEKVGTTIGPNDLLIAGQAKARELVLVTHNVREFSRVDGLAIEDWQGGL